MTITWELIAQIADKLGVIAFFIIVLTTGSRGIWVWKRELDRRDVDIAEVRQREQWWKDLAIRNNVIGERAVEVAKTAVNETHKA